MRVLVVGGSGYVAGLVLPLLPDRFQLRIFDRQPPAWLPAIQNPKSKIQNVIGDVTDPDALIVAAQGMDVLLYMAMGKCEKDIDNAPAAYDVNVKGVHLALDAAVKAGLKRAVYTSSLSVYDGHLDIRSGATDSEEVYPQPTQIYGFTKWLGEQVCMRFTRAHGLPILALRLFRPVSREEWHAAASPPSLETLPSLKSLPSLPSEPDCRTSAPDLARALTAALDLEHTGFEAIHLTGDTTGRAYNHQKAKRLLNWEPHQGKVIS